MKKHPFRPLAIVLTTALLASPVGRVFAGERPADWATPEAIVHALYESISADPNGQRDWDRYRALFFKDARMAIALDGKVAQGIMSMSSEQLVEQTEANYRSTGFHEIPLVTRVQRHGAMASVYSSFEVRLRATDPKPLMRGLNHFQLLHDGERWWIVSNVGVMETPNSPLPAEFANASPSAR
ncbi:hypothetical protein ACFOED_13215 [Vulcaniibacterium thermophilum]|jgi:hypothetical protein|uniref:DUF4440 domain-containing protein n=1 Tax=Vulcaniibacterium thermophilum TaxID=1169913 RepID=A0A918Z3U4_9GAMM|nr:hypothetical protein [Vulcaniibacterium thermophilum]GHE32966.1 hypothetical protein GCM10007167_13780 [Vulcaniibacterium thermophilum]